jgi:hypothetical protein
MTKATTTRPTTAELIAGIRAHAQKNWGKGGWDILAECWDDEDIGRCIAEGDTLPRAIASVKRVLRAMDEHRREIMSTAW